MDGVETTAIIRQMGGKFADIPIVALTANAVHGAKEMFLANGFNDFVSKPINSAELAGVLVKWLPPQKVQQKSKEDNRRAVLEKEAQLRQKAIVTFVKENRDTFDKIKALLSCGDIKTAHRVAHTLKSNAGYLGKIELQNAAASLEDSLGNEPATYSQEQLDVFERGLSAALREFEPIAREIESNKPKAVEIDTQRIYALLAEIEPLLENNDFGAVNYVEELQGIAGMGALAERIDDYDFDGALSLVVSLKNKQ
jgi:HPt (histidine-containing phosphotransfer) domain-containing protein